MTRQISDEIFYRGKAYCLSDSVGFGIDVPEEYHILDMISFSTSCWRGFRCSYEVANDLLFVTHPQGGSRFRLEFTGAMLLGDDYIYDLWGMITPDTYKNRTVHELVFQEGRLQEEHDRSSQVAEFRQMLNGCEQVENSDATAVDIRAWIKRSFCAEFSEFERDYTEAVFLQSVRGRRCKECDCTIDLGRFIMVPDATRCLPCQVAFEEKEELGMKRNPLLRP